MKSNILWMATACLFSLLTLDCHAQRAKPDEGVHEQKVRDMVAFFEYMLNTLGDASTPASDKDVLVTESYTKIFRDGKVQVEDDLDENRKVITNKDVQAYLKDVDFFFTDVAFELNIEDIEREATTGDKFFYKVSLTRNLKGTTIGGKSVNKTIPRYIEVNYDPQQQDLKIVSIYTNEFNEKEALTGWWNQLSYAWQDIFKRKLNLTDSVELDDIKRMTAIDTLDLHDNTYIRNIEPLTQLLDLRVLDLSGTAITDLSPIRNLTELEELDLSGTRVEDLSSLRYAMNLLALNISHTAVRDISVFEKLASLETLEMRATPVVDFDPLKNLTALQRLNLESTACSTFDPIDSLRGISMLNASKTPVEALTPLANLENLTVLNVDSTRIRDLEPLGNLKNLKVLYVNHTAVSDLRPLESVDHLERIYCDHTGINRALANAFVTSNPDVLVIFESDDLRGWWHRLPGEWQEVLSKTAAIGLNPTKEELAKVTNLDSVNLANNSAIKDLEPLNNLRKLRTVIARGTSISNLTPLVEHQEIRWLDIRNTDVADLSILHDFPRLHVLLADHSKIQEIDTLAGIRSLKRLYVDGTGVNDTVVQDFLRKLPDCLVVYKTDTLTRWWDTLSEDWKHVFHNAITLSTAPAREHLHQLVELEKLQVMHAPIDDLSSLHPFIRLKELHFSGTRIRDLSPLSRIKSLKRLQASNGPVQSLAPVGKLTALEELDISNTPVDDLAPLGRLKQLKRLNCSGTPVKKLNPLEALRELEHLDCANSDVKSLGPVTGLPLKTLKCYNTRIPRRQVERFQEKNPDCDVTYYR